MPEENRFSDDGKIHDKQRLKELQALPLERKMQITQTRLIEWYTAWDGKCYVSFSGGKDSTVLADQAAKVCKMLGYKLVLWFSDTGLEYPEIKLTFHKFIFYSLFLFVVLKMDFNSIITNHTPVAVSQLNSNPKQSVIR